MNLFFYTISGNCAFSPDEKLIIVGTSANGDTDVRIIVTMLTVLLSFFFKRIGWIRFFDILRKRNIQ